MIQSLQIKNFKAIAQARLRLTPLTALIGYNGSGKSSMLEALEMFQTMVTDGLDKAIAPWRAFEHIYYKGRKTRRKFERDGFPFQYAPIEFSFKIKLPAPSADGPLVPKGFSSAIGEEKTSNGLVYFLEEKIQYPLFERGRDADDVYITQDKKASWDYPDRSIIDADRVARTFIGGWQFLSMNTFLMGNPTPQRKTGGSIKLNKDGSNVAEYLLSIREQAPSAFESIIETLQRVLPYAKDIQPAITQELEKMVYLQLTEQDFKVPGWLFSTGTLKVLALLAVLRHPEPATLVVIEELENGLDPRTVHMIVDEIREVVKTTATQVIITTHSPYLLDLLHLSQIVFVERGDGKVAFKRPYDSDTLRQWSKEYTPGELYRRDLLKRGMQDER